jgi:hypothetical protein
MGMTSSFPHAGLRFTAEERAAITADFDRRARPPVFEKYAWVFKLFYVLAAMAVVAGGGVMYRFRETIPVREGGIAAAVVVLMLVLLGAVPPMFLRGAAASEAFGRAQAAVEMLARSHSDAQPARRSQAIAILVVGSLPAGIWSGNSFDVRAASARLGAALEYVQAVEQVLIEERGIKGEFNHLII